MSKKAVLRVVTDGPEGFFRRGRETACRLDRREPIGSTITISFESVERMQTVLSPECVRLLCTLKAGEQSLSVLASDLRRDKRAVSRDVAKLREHGLLEISYDINPGHGRKLLVRPIASHFQVTAEF